MKAFVVRAKVLHGRCNVFAPPACGGANEVMSAEWNVKRNRFTTDYTAIEKQFVTTEAKDF